MYLLLCEFAHGDCDNYTLHALPFYSQSDLKTFLKMSKRYPEDIFHDFPHLKKLWPIDNYSARLRLASYHCGIGVIKPDGKFIVFDDIWSFMFTSWRTIEPIDLLPLLVNNMEVQK